MHLDASNVILDKLMYLFIFFHSFIQQWSTYYLWDTISKTCEFCKVKLGTPCPGGIYNLIKDALKKRERNGNQ